MSEPLLPEPLVPADCDLRDFAFMPLDVTRLFGSRFHAIANDSEWRAGVTLWAKSWQQVPTASLPDDDVELCRLAELGRDLRAWRKVKAAALHGWIKCSDGRLYHPTVAEKALDAFAKKRTASLKGKAGNEKRWRKTSPEDGGSDRQDPRGKSPGDNRNDASAIAQGSPDESPGQSNSDPAAIAQGSHEDRKGQGEGEGHREGEEKQKLKASRASRTPDPNPDLLLADVDPQVRRDWLAIRAKKRLPLTQTAHDEIRAEVAKAGLSMESALRICCRRGWASFESKWDWKHGDARVNGGGLSAKDAERKRVMDQIHGRKHDDEQRTFEGIAERLD